MVAQRPDTHANRAGEPAGKATAIYPFAAGILGEIDLLFRIQAVDERLGGNVAAIHMPGGTADIPPRAGEHGFGIGGIVPIVVVTENFCGNTSRLKCGTEVVVDKIDLLHGAHLHARIGFRRIIGLILHGDGGNRNALLRISLNEFDEVTCVSAVAGGAQNTPFAAGE